MDLYNLITTIFYFREKLPGCGLGVLLWQKKKTSTKKEAKR